MTYTIYYLPFTIHQSYAYTNPTAAVAAYDNYDPWGMTLEGLSGVSGNPDTRYKFTEKERDAETGLDYFGARYYDSRIGRWLAVDPLADRFSGWSPYVYGLDNPVRYDDPDGEGPGDRVKAARAFVGKKYQQETSTTLRTGSTQKALEFMDCSELVSRVMALDGIVESDKTFSTSQLAEILSDDTKYEHSAKMPQVGDIALWAGHTGIVTEVGEGGTIKLTHARGENKLALENPHLIPPNLYKPGKKFLGYYRPRKETKDGKLDAEVPNAEGSDMESNGK